MRRTVFADKPGTVETQYHREFLYRYVMNDIVICPLHERRINVTERYEPVFRHTAGESNGMPFGDADIKCAFRHFLHKDIHGATAWHGRSHADNLRIGFSQFYQRVSEYILKEGRHSFRIDNETFAGHGVKLTRSMPFGGMFLCRGKSFSFYCVQVQDFRTLQIFDVMQYAGKVLYVVSVYRTEIADVHSLENVLLLRSHRLQAVAETYQRFATFFIQDAELE